MQSRLLLALVLVHLGCAPEANNASVLESDKQAARVDAEWHTEAYLANLYQRGNDNENEVDATGNADYLTAEMKIRLKVEAHRSDPALKRFTAYYSVIIPKCLDDDGRETLVFETSMARNFWMAADDQGRRLAKQLEYSKTENPTPTFHAGFSFERRVDLVDGHSTGGELYIGFKRDPQADMENWHHKLVWQTVTNQAGELSVASIELIGNPDVYGDKDQSYGKKPGEIILVESNFIEAKHWTPRLKMKIGRSRVLDETNPLQPRLGSDRD